MLVGLVPCLACLLCIPIRLAAVVDADQRRFCLKVTPIRDIMIQNTPFCPQAAQSRVYSGKRAERSRRNLGEQMMRGIVIWVSPDEYSALIWCEDSQEIAVAKGAMAWRNPMRPVTVGDYVGFSCRISGDHRQCSDVHTIVPQMAPDLAEMILSPSSAATTPMAAACLSISGQGRGTGNRLLHLCPSRD